MESIDRMQASIDAQIHAMTGASFNLDAVKAQIEAARNAIAK